VLAQTDAARERPKEGDLLVPVSGSSPEPLKPDDRQLDAKQTMAWPMDPETKTVRNGSRLNKVLLLRLDPDGFDPETKNHAVEGVVAYSATCTHTGCDVTNWNPGRQLLGCPCHYSIYDPKEGAKVVGGRLPAGYRHCR
jgi:Rieske Fe-S protein